MKLVGPHVGLQVGKCRAFGAPMRSSIPPVLPTASCHRKKLKGPNDGLQVEKWTVHDEQAPWNDSYVAYVTK